MANKAFRQELLAELEKIKTVDCHSHTQLKSAYYENGPFDLFSLTSYFDRDIQSTAGGPIYEGAKDDKERWLRLKQVLCKSRNVSYWRHNLVVYQKLFGLTDNELTDDNWRQVNDAIRRKSKDSSWYDHVTKELCNLKTQVRNIPWFESWEEEYFTAVLRMELALELHKPDVREQLEQHVDMPVDSLKSAKGALLKLTKEYADKGAIGIKLAHAYGRTLHSVPVDDNVASRIFDSALSKHEVNADEVKHLQDNIIFYLAEIAQDMGLVFQVHTGVQSNWGNVPESDPLLLIPLLKEFPDVRFDLFHAGYPYSRMLGMLGKHYPNVWLNMAWMYVISTAASRHVLSEWLDLVPGYRILGFGSDVRFPEMILGHLEMARSCVADVLAEKVEKDFLSVEEALSLARRMFRENGMALYGLTD
jgi:predicted TIM-barrel fold metal-dependent hydrolase